MCSSYIWISLGPHMASLYQRNKDLSERKVSLEKIGVGNMRIYRVCGATEESNEKYGRALQTRACDVSLYLMT